jgi:hypothetical protein
VILCVHVDILLFLPLSARQHPYVHLISDFISRVWKLAGASDTRSTQRSGHSTTYFRPPRSTAQLPFKRGCSPSHPSSLPHHIHTLSNCAVRPVEPSTYSVIDNARHPDTCDHTS